MTTSIITQEMLTMTSREIATLLESRHDNVKVSIDRLVLRGVISRPAMQDVKNDNNQVVQEYLVCKRDTYVIVAQLSPEFTARLVDRWQELENRQYPALPDFTNPAIAARAWADEIEQKHALQVQLAAAAPAVEFVEKYVDSTGLKSFRQVCKLLGANESEFRRFLNARHIMYRLGGEWVPYACHIDAGRFVVKAGTSESGHAFNSARFTSKGVEWVAGEFAKFQLNSLEVAA